MCNQTEVLTILTNAVDAPVPVAAIAYAVWRKDRRQNEQRVRRQVLYALGNLMQNKLAERSPEPKQPVSYLATDKGFALIASGGRVTSGPKRPHTGDRKPQVNTLRARLWTALRLKKKATVPELLEIARLPGDGDKETNLARNVQSWMKALVRAGVAAELSVRGQGYAPTSNGFKRFSLISDLGPQAPIASAKHLFDPNSGKRIAYGAPKAKAA
jgi:hypothetical protein